MYVFLGGSDDALWGCIGDSPVPTKVRIDENELFIDLGLRHHWHDEMAYVITAGGRAGWFGLDDGGVPPTPTSRRIS